MILIQGFRFRICYEENVQILSQGPRCQCASNYQIVQPALRFLAFVTESIVTDLFWIVLPQTVTQAFYATQNTKDALRQ